MEENGHSVRPLPIPPEQSLPKAFMILKVLEKGDV